jgi:hypothetical protein
MDDRPVSNIASVALAELRDRRTTDRERAEAIRQLIERCEAHKASTTVDRLELRLRAAPDTSATALKIRDDLRAQRDALHASQPWRRRR